MSTARPAMAHQYRTAIIGLAIAVGLLFLKQAIDLVAGPVSGQLASSATYSLALATNFLALVAAACGTGRARRAGIGYAICGWSYFFLALSEATPFARKPPLITSLAFELLTGVSPMRGGGGPDSMLWAAHAAVTLAAGGVGAWFASRLLDPGAVPGPMGSLLDLVRSFRPARAERPAVPPAAPIHPLDRTD